MAVLQKIRNRGVLLVCAIGLGLLLFILGDLFTSGRWFFNKNDGTTAIINGNKLDYQEFQKLYNGFQQYMEYTQGTSVNDDDQVNMIKDQAWQTYLQYSLVKNECDELGLGVSDKELVEALSSSQFPLMQIPQFMNESRQFDYSVVKTFVSQYNNLKNQENSQVPREYMEEYEKLYNYYTFAQTIMRQQLLVQKYNNLLTNCIISNPIEAQNSFNGRTENKKTVVATIPIGTVDDKEVKVEEKEISAKYQEMKARYIKLAETRDIKYIDVTVLPSQKDKDALQNELKGYYNQLKNTENDKDAAQIVRQSNSRQTYSHVMKSKNAFPLYVASKIDSLAKGYVEQPQFDPATKTYYTFKVLDKDVIADSVLFRQVIISGQSEEDVTKRADSVMNAIASGSTLAELAKKFNQPTDSMWRTTAQYERYQLTDDDTKYIKELFDAVPGSVQSFKLKNGATLVYEVLEKRNPITKFDVAIVAKEEIFSDDTYKEAYDKLSTFLATNKTLKDIEANAEKSGFHVQQLDDVDAASHNVGNISKSHDALKWLFDEADINEVSPLYECGNHDRLLVVALTAINPEGFTSEAKVKESLTQELTREKKIELIASKNNGVKDIQAAKAIKGAMVDTITVNFANSAYIPSISIPEPILSAAVSKVAEGQFKGPIKGQMGVYFAQVISKEKNEAKFDAKSEEADCRRMNQQYVNYTSTASLMFKANVKDFRYKYF